MRDNWFEAWSASGMYTDVGLWEGAPNAPLIRAVGERNTCVRTCITNRQDNFYLGYGTGGYQGAIALRDNIHGLRLSENALLGSELQGIIFGIEGWRPLLADDVVLDRNVMDETGEIGVRFLPSATVNGLAMTDNRIVDSGKTDVSMEGKLTDVETKGNLVDRLPVVTGDVQGDADGFRVTRWDSSYVDHYAWIRKAPADTAPLDVDAQTRRLPIGKKVWNVQQFGATGNGRTNDLRAIVKALEKVGKKQGGTLVFPKGTYRIRTSEGMDHTVIRHHLALVAAHGVRIAGKGATLVFDDPDAVGLRLVGCTDVQIEGLTLVGPGLRKLRHNRPLLEISGCERVRVSGVTARKSAGHGIKVDSSALVLVRDCKVTDTNGSGIEVAASRQVTVTKCTIDKARDNGVFVTWLGSICIQMQYITIVDNTITRTTEGCGVGVVTGDFVSVKSNRISETYLAGIWVWPRGVHYPPRRVTFQGNTLTRTNRGERSHTPGAISVVALNAAKRYAEIEILDNTINTTQFAGVWVGGSALEQQTYAEIERLVIRGNTVTGAAGVAVGLSADQLAHTKEASVQ